MEPSTRILASRGLVAPDRSRPSIVAAKGAWLTDDGGRRIFDAACGSGSLIFGHCDPELIQILAQQSGRLTLYPSGAFRVAEVERYATALSRFAPDGFTRAITMSSGSDAVEAALKACLQFHGRNGDVARTVFIGREASYHGNSLAGLAAGGFVSRRAPYEHVLPDWPKAGVADMSAQDADSPIASLKAAMEAASPERVAAVIIEPVVGAALSAVPPPADYVRQVRDLCDSSGALLIADEVMTGFGRTGRPFASGGWDVVPDVIVCGKAISAGHYPLSAILVNELVADRLTFAGGFFENGQTNCWNPVAAAVGNAVVERLSDEPLLDNARAMGSLLRERLRQSSAGTVLRKVRGEGLMIGFDLEPQSGREGAGPADLGPAFHQAAIDRGVLIYPSRGGPRRVKGDHALMLPPLTITEEHVAYLASALGAAAAEVAERHCRG
jgi:adenosylmethionine-8-amino-7-oxononanoate aminotransferase